MDVGTPSTCQPIGRGVESVYRSVDGSSRWVDLGSDGTIDAIARDGLVYLPLAIEPAPATARRWFTVPDAPDDPLGFFAGAQSSWDGTMALVRDQASPLAQAQRLHDEGEDNPAQLFEDDPGFGSLSWRTDGDGRVVEANLTVPSAEDPVRSRVLLVSDGVEPVLPEVPVDAEPLADQPVAEFISSSNLLDPRCGSISRGDAAALQPCLADVAGSQTVGEWTASRDKLGAVQVPFECR